MIAAILLCALSPERASAQGAAILTNPGFLTYTLAANDDGSTAAVPLGFKANFFGTTYSSVFVNNNGNLTFLSGLAAYTPENLAQSSLPIIAPFWANVDTHGAGSGLVTYGTDVVNGFTAFGANYINVGYYNEESNLLDSFQVVLIDRSDTGPGNFDIEFNYNSILWETGDASGGAGGLGGISAAAGFSNGQCFSGSSNCSYLQIAGSLVPGSFLNSNPNGLIYRTLNSTLPGRLVFSVRGGVVCCSTPPPALSVSPANVTASLAAGSGAASRAIAISSNSGAQAWTLALEAYGGAAGWLTASASSGTATAGKPSVAPLSFKASGLTAGIYQGQITVQNSSGATVGAVPVMLEVTAGGQLVLNQLSFVFSIQQGGAAPPTQTLQVVNGGQGNMNWSISAPASPQFSVSASGGVAEAGTGGSSIALGVNPTGLSPGIYQNLFQVSAPGAADGSQAVLVTLQVVSSGAAAQGQMDPGGMLFTATQGGAASPAQVLAINNIGGGGLSFTLQATTSSGGNWLSVSPAGGTAGPGPATAEVSASAGNLTPGIYRGDIVAGFAGGPTQQAEVVLVVAPASGCVPTGMDMLVSSMNSGASPAVSFPQPLLAQVVDNCGNPVNTASVAVGVDGLNIVLPSVGNGMYSGSWTPQNQAETVAAVFTAVDPVLGALERSYTVTEAAPEGESLAAVLPAGVVGAAAFPTQAPLAPGSIIAIFGSNLASAPNSATQIPLPLSLGGVSVTIGGMDAPLYYAGSGQINAQVPFSLTAGQSVSIVVTANGMEAAPQNYLIAPAEPAIFTIPTADGTIGAVLNAQNQLITSSNPAHLGDAVVIYANGLGLTNPAVATGQASPAAQAVLPVTVTVGGVQVPVQYAGLTPTLAGENQINIQLTGNIPTGDNVPVVVTQNGVPSNQVSISIQ